MSFGRAYDLAGNCAHNTIRGIDRYEHAHCFQTPPKCLRRQHGVQKPFGRVAAPKFLERFAKASQNPWSIPKARLAYRDC